MKKGSFDEHMFRHCLGCFATGITVAAAVSPEGTLCGVTINAFSSVSLRPPMVAFNLKKKAHTYHAFAHARHFIFNVLNEQQIDISRHFSSSTKDNWEAIDYTRNALGLPEIKGCLATLTCENAAVYAGGDHSIFLGKVIDLTVHGDKRPLLYFHGNYHTLGELHPLALPKPHDE